MDHDDNDFQGQNLQLAGEGNSNFSPVLRPYALHKFDFEDSLNGHLRFDTLVENEVFLGIPSQEDNQWIEDFSRGNSGIEFNSGAAESCSISRRHNVWSEATSSESVEMLLKSVGQGEMIVPGQSDGCTDLEKHGKIDDAVVLDKRDIVSEENLVIDGELKNIVEESLTVSIRESLQDIATNERLDEREVSDPRVEHANELPEEHYIKSCEAECNVVIASEIVSKSCDYDIASNKELSSADSSLIFTEETNVTKQLDDIPNEETKVVYGENNVEISTDNQMNNKTDKTVGENAGEAMDQKIEGVDIDHVIQSDLITVVDGLKNVCEENVLFEQGDDVLEVCEVEKENLELPSKSSECNNLEGGSNNADGELDASREKKQVIIEISENVVKGADQSEEQEKLAASITEDEQEGKIENITTFSLRNESSVQKVSETSCIAPDASEIVDREVVQKESEETGAGQNYDITNIIMTEKAEFVEKNIIVASSQVTDEIPIQDQIENMNRPVDSSVKPFPLVDQEANHSVVSDFQPVEVNSPSDPIPSSVDGANCGSPTVISGIEVSHSERDKHENTLSQESYEKVQSGTKENESSKEEKSFTFEVSPSVGLPEAETGKGWRSFPTVQACKITTFEVSPAKVGQINFTTPQETPQSCPQEIELGSIRKATPERKPRRSSAKSAGKEVGKKGTHAKEKNLAKELDNKLLGPTSQSGSIHIKQSGAKESGITLVPASNLPDLNTSVPPASLFQQPFSDVQQVQLRAQIFVYGSLIQGAAPDEACMVSAFGPSETGRGVWEPKWRAYYERIHAQKCNANSTESTAQPRSGSNSKTPDQSPRINSSHQSNISPVSLPATKSTPTGTTVGGGTPKSAVNPMIPLSSPLWNLPTPTCERNPLLDYHQSLSPVNSYQPPSVRKFVAPNNPSWLSQVSFPNPWMPSPQSSSYDASNRFARFPVTESVKLTPVKEIKDSSALSLPIPLAHSVMTSLTEPKSRKRKKVLVTEDLTPQIHAIETKKITVTEDIGRMSLFPLTKQESVSAPAVNALFSTSVAVSTSPNDHVKKGDYSRGKMDDVEVIKTQAEEASRNAATAATNCDEVWSRLFKQKNSGFVSDNEFILAGAAVAVSAASEVAKAAAAAAQIASHAAVQAKLIVDEALASAGSTLMTAATAASPANLEGGDTGNSSDSPIIFVAKEAASRRMETASAASKHAENLDLIVRAAELAAEAVSQAGKIVAAGDPLTLAELLDLGPEGYLKQFKMSNTVQDVRRMSGKQSDEGQSNKEMPTISHNEHSRKDISMALQESPLGTTEKVDSRGETGNIREDFGLISTSDTGRDESEKDDYSSTINIIKQGCLVEVFKDGGNGITGWYSARVLRLKDEKAFVGFTELISDKEQLQEWVPLCENGDEVPKIRAAHHSERTRKRRRSALTDYTWSIGDKVDAWVDNCWCEGVVTEKKANDETTLIVRLAAQGEKSVKIWDVRPILVYKDGEWTEWTAPMASERTFQGDTPKEKRMKLGSPSGEKGWKNNNKKVEPEKHSGSTSILPLSIGENTFNVGKSTDRVDTKKLDVAKPTRANTSFQGSSGVNIGISKPGKKRKFMAVSEHYTSSDNSTKSKTPANSSVKFTNYLMKQGGGELKSKAARSSGKPPTASGRTLPQKVNQPLTTIKHSVSDNSNDERESGGQPKSAKFEMNAEVGGGMVFSSKPLPQAKFNSTTSERRVMTNKSKSVPGKSVRAVEVKEKPTVPDAILEPQRRSNRRIQPTSRLLEGLQSSLTISKIPSASHDKSHRAQNRGTPKGN